MLEVADVVIVGAGLAGLAAARTLASRGKEALVLEAADMVGGLARSYRVDGYTFDCSGHLLHLKDERVLQLVKEVTTPDDWLQVERKSLIVLEDALVPYPFQSHLAFAPDAVREECLRTLPTRAANPTSDSSKLSLHDWATSNLGEGISRHFMVPYNEKLSTVAAKELVATALGRFLPTPSLDEIRQGAVVKRESNAGYNASFRYPVRGGIDLLPERMAEGLTGIVTRANVVRVDLRQRIVETSDGRQFQWRDRLLSTMPLPTLARVIGEDELVSVASGLRANQVTCVNVGFVRSGDRLEGVQWVYLPEETYHAYRVGLYTGLSSVMAPPGRAAAYVEIAHSAQTPVKSEVLIQQALSDLSMLGLIRGLDDVEVVVPVKIDTAYVIHDRECAPRRDQLLARLDSAGVTSFGRYGRWEYSAMEDAIVQGITAAKAC